MVEIVIEAILILAVMAIAGIFIVAAYGRRSIDHDSGGAHEEQDP